MSDRPSHNLGGLDIDLARRIDEVCRRFEADLAGGEPTAHRRLSGRRGRRGPVPHCGPSWRPWSASCARRRRTCRASRPARHTTPSPEPAPPSPRSPRHRPSPRGRRRLLPIPGAATADIHDDATAAAGDRERRPPSRSAHRHSRLRGLRSRHAGGDRPGSATSATTRSSARSPAAAWASSSRPGR